LFQLVVFHFYRLFLIQLGKCGRLYFSLLHIRYPCFPFATCKRRSFTILSPMLSTYPLPDTHRWGCPISMSFQIFLHKNSKLRSKRLLFCIYTHKK
jgi:hypothetical protein